MNTKLKILVACTALFPLAACSSAKDALGLSHRAPDEFAIVKRAPLVMPPDYSLRPPEPGAPRPQEVSPQVAARDATLGAQTNPATTSDAESFLLQKTGGDQADQSIRAVVNTEAAKQAPAEQPVAKKLLGIGKDQEPGATVVDPAAESARLKANKDAGKSVVDGETPTIEQ